MKNFYFKRVCLLFVSVLLLSSGLKAQIEDFQVGTTNRRMLVFAPSDIEPNRPLLITMHGMNQDINYQQNMTQWETVARENNFVLVYPGGLNNRWSLSGTTDTDFILAIIDEMYDRYEIDRDRVYLSGFSMGGMMTYYAATRIADKIAAFAPVGGYLMAGPNTNSSRPIPLIHTHGTSDDVVVFSGVQRSLDAWIERNNCPTEPVVENIPNLNTVKSTWGPGTDSVEVVLLRQNGVGHWHSGVSTSRLIWNFLERFSLGFGVSRFTHATVTDNDPSRINVYFSLPMKELDSYEGFTVYIDNQEAEIDTVIYSGENLLQIILVEDVLNSHELMLSYSNGNIVSVYDKDLVEFSDKIIDNLLQGAAPRIIELFTTEDGEMLVINFNKEMQLPSDLSGLSLKALYDEDLSVSLLQSSFFANDSTQLAFTLEERVFADYELLLTYSGSEIKSVDDAALRPFSDLKVTNNSTGLPVTAESGQLEDNAFIVAINFSKAMKITNQQLTQLTVKVNGEPVSVRELFVVRNTVRLVLTNNLHYGDEITVSYAPGDIKAADKGALEAFTDLEISNPLASPVWQTVPGKVEAEDFYLQFGTDTEPTSDVGGGRNVGWTDSGNWLEYALENNTTETKFKISFRIAANAAGSSFQYFINNVRAGTVSVPSTGGWQNWQTIEREIDIEEGKHYLKILVVNGGFNLNYFDIQLPTGVDDLNMKDINIYPNPASHYIVVDSPDFIYNKVEIIDLNGRIVLSKSIAYETELHLPISLSDGVYTVKLSSINDTAIRKVIVRNE